jgi:hypothetical protein
MNPGLFGAVEVATNTIVGPPGPLPVAIANWPAEAVLDLSGLDPVFGLEGLAFWPVTVTEPDFDRDTETLTGDIIDAIADPETQTITATYGVRPLTDAEIQAAQPAFANPPIIGVRYSATMALGEDGELVKLVAAGDGSTGFSEAAEQTPGDVLLYMWPVPPTGYIVKVEAPGYGCSTYEAGSENGVVGVRFYSLATGDQGRPPGDFHAEVQW